LLNYLDSSTLPDHVFDGLLEDLACRGLSDSHVQAVIDTGLVEYISKPYIDSELNNINSIWAPDELGFFQLTNLGKEVIGRLKQTNS